MGYMNTKGHIVIICAIMATVLFALLLVLPITPLVIVSYVISMLAIVLFCFGMMSMISNRQSYPWFAAFPKTTLRYMVSQFILSAVFVIAELAAGWTIPMRWFVLLHILLFAFFAIMLIMLRGGREIIDKRGEEVKEKVMTMRLLHADAESLMRRFPAHEPALKRVVEALRYSDPMSHSALAVYEEQIQRALVEMNDGQNLDSRCEDVLRLIADRNSRVKIMK
jgi:hypothetical protein